MLADRWRLLDTGSLAGAWNMAVDEALLECFDPSASPPVFRLYGWTPPAFSLGRFQDAAAVFDLDRCRADGVPVVRRITGGGALYHADELTYSLVCAPSRVPGGGSATESFRHLNRFLLDFYRGLGLAAAYAADLPGGPARLGTRTDFCFAGRERFDIVVDGRKIGGNAQRRVRHAVFQHGSIPLLDRVPTALRYLREPPADAGPPAAALRTLGVDLPPEALRERLVAAFRHSLGGLPEPSTLTRRELERAALLARRQGVADPAG